jgi:4-hydroxy-tetrahydrodipicolinate reductase
MHDEAQRAQADPRRGQRSLNRKNANLLNIALIGYGKMGKGIEELALQAGDNIVLRISSGNPEALTGENLRKADVAIEFSRPESAAGHIEACLAAGVPVVCGTTGWTDRMPEVKTLAERSGGALFYAANFSVGMNILFSLNRRLARLMNNRPEYGVRLYELHHTEKKDAPSGTAIQLADDIVRGLDRKTGWMNRQGGEADQVYIESERTGQAPGTHEVVYYSAVDSLSLRHEAVSREGFARGALAAARWLVGRKGVFGMEDMLDME